MKYHRTGEIRRSLARAFTLLELLVVISIIAVLAALTMGAFQYAQQSSSRDRTKTTHQAIKSALETYKEKFGEYPAAANPSLQSSSSAFRIGGAMMLYQAITGDGNSEIKLAIAGNETSDGQVSEEEAENVINGNLPKSTYLKTSDGYYMVDGWNRPFQYSKDEPDTLNTTAYDLWSYGNLKNDMTAISDLETKKKPEVTGTWIKNW